MSIQKEIALEKFTTTAEAPPDVYVQSLFAGLRLVANRLCTDPMVAFAYEHLLLPWIVCSLIASQRSLRGHSILAVHTPRK